MSKQIKPNSLENEIEHPREDIIGYADLIDKNYIIHGWACDRMNLNRKVYVNAIIDGKIIASAKADVFREDLKLNGYGDGAHGFKLPLPPDYLSRDELISIYVENIDVELNGSPLKSNGLNYSKFTNKDIFEITEAAGQYFDETEKQNQRARIIDILEPKLKSLQKKAATALIVDLMFISLLKRAASEDDIKLFGDLLNKEKSISRVVMRIMDSDEYHCSRKQNLTIDTKLIDYLIAPYHPEF